MPDHLSGGLVHETTLQMAPLRQKRFSQASLKAPLAYFIRYFIFRVRFNSNGYSKCRTNYCSRTMESILERVLPVPRLPVLIFCSSFPPFLIFVHDCQPYYCCYVSGYWPICDAVMNGFNIRSLFVMNA